MANETNTPKRPNRSIISYILPLLIFAAVIGLIIFFVFGNKQSTELTENEFKVNLVEKKIDQITVTPKEHTLVIIDGYYYPKGSTAPAKFYVKMGYHAYYEETDLTYVNEKQEIVKIEVKDATAQPVSLTLDSYACLQISATRQDHKAAVYTNDPYQTSWWDQWGPTLIMLGGSLIIVIFLFSRLSSSVGGANNKALDFNKSRARRENTSKVKFDNVAGCDEEKYEMQELVSYLKEPKKYSKFGAKLPKGVLLVGPPGTGKTLLAKAVAGEAGVPFYSISGSDFVEMFVGVGAGRVRDMFRIAKENAPCLIFIDEIDAVGRQRGAGLGGGNDEREQTLNQLLVEMDGFSDNSGIIVIAATNRDDVLDPALLRAGRFDRKITVNLPDRKGREEIFKIHSKNKILEDNIDFANLSKRTVGFSGADIENVMNEAAILAVRKNEEKVSLADIDEAIDRRISGPAKSSRSLSEHEKKLVSYHEAGHAVIGIFLPYSDKVQKITIVPRGNTGGHVLMTPEDDKFLLSKNELQARIVGYLGGRTSEEIFFDDITTGAQNDIEVATRIARMMVTELGMSKLGPIQYEKDTGSVFLGRDYASSQKNFSTEVAFEIDKEIRTIIEDAHNKAREVLTEHKDDVIKIANVLMEKETITAEEIESLLKSESKTSEEKPSTSKKPRAKKKVEKTPEGDDNK